MTMQESIPPRTLRSFGFLVGAGFSIIGMWPLLFRQETPRLWALTLSVMLVLGGVLIPRLLLPLYRGWMALGEALGWVNTRIILGVIFFLVVTPIGIFKRLFGSDAMRRRFEPDAESYRVPKSPRSVDHMRRQF